MDDFIGWHWLTADGVVMLEEAGDCYRPGEGKSGFFWRDYCSSTAC